MPSTVTLDLADEAATHRLGQLLAGIAGPGDIFALEGDLGSGKTSLARAFIRALTDDAEDVPSPTFTLAQVYESDLGTLWHFDLYRLEKPDDALELGIEDAFADGISLIEWPDRLGSWLPADHLTIALSPGAESRSRRARLTGGGDWPRRLQEIFGD
ncbi:tRNA (adenosine(37)-N6)-threonylcarbamoyltransferase complex ATPase subunit type 1 TsaE [Telmatospirillum sp.]|uniref:tRNA (adenosine(37)-N6)-threonylcarbamoyltransferase complex ATPase subunit type 1 TsaE n=1 Tax=Telmatospirillum sp. TaxID=2079197 RepID=UPI00284071A8|nr:tRNA (adenosine(37)-N6)-threonylcarbamoyltransferase complex ATPase subunit type 1 TsaE [Telmatospirillum sp.]MDR3440366.1 tRNA (adenosine(37)-N6)-threonylcarbamoyltransferase complex ATPase subunit type 1 TsaE [Telmatospirillum sp.]